MSAMDDRHQLFGAVLGTIQAELDWERLGRAYCEGDGTDFFDDELRERWLDVGLQIGATLAEALNGSRGRSVYVGAALAEVPTMLVESIVLGRDVVWINLPGDEIDELARVMQLVAEKFGIALPAPSFESLESLPRGAFDHVWMVSVLTDPDHFPALHDELYERHGTELATGRGSLVEDRERAERLVGSMLELAAPAALITTTDEELEIARSMMEASKSTLNPILADHVSAIVGDQLRVCRSSVMPGAS